jgi:YgiT-type zinc finger domain-containing protein
MNGSIIEQGKITSNTNQTCPLCGGKKTKGKTTFSADLGSGVVVVRQVEATICAQCGEEWIDDATARRLEQIVNDARARQLEVEVATMK